MWNKEKLLEKNDKIRNAFLLSGTLKVVLIKAFLMIFLVIGKSEILKYFYFYDVIILL